MPNKSAASKLYRTTPFETTHYSIFHCEVDSQAAELVLRYPQDYSSSLSPGGLLHLEVEAPDPFALPTVAIIITGLELLWSNRMMSAATSEATMKAELDARAALFRQTQGRRLCKAGAIMANILSLVTLKNHTILVDCLNGIQEKETSLQATPFQNLGLVV